MGVKTFIVSCKDPTGGTYDVHVPAPDAIAAMERAREYHDVLQVLGTSDAVVADPKQEDPLARAGLLMSAAGIVVPLLALGGIVCGCIANGRTKGRDGAAAIGVGIIAIAAQAVFIAGLASM